ncbi:putative photosynthetic complex assembly protein PuhE [Tropicibacter sp. S64]|uniref:putative photosynthetic complex assembly protein PuhE n=1 Tax=Tropicibacter sp. S64 TaxID=3415122 RepID=UPI003C7D8BF5
MASPWIAALLALFAWWFSTGVILMVVRLADRFGPRGRRITTLCGLPLLVAGIFGYEASLSAHGTAAAYAAFASALAVWGWIELSFLTGAITGPNHHDCPKDVPEWERFLRAWGTVAYHEMLLTAVLILMWLYGAGALNTVGLWTFTILYFARISAKLNLYFGVPRINVEFLPRALSHLASHFRIAALNWVFPVSVTALSFATACWLDRLATSDDPAARIGFALVASITALALLEHWVMVLPLPDAKLWRWMLPAPKHQTTRNRRRPEGFHGL